MHSFYAYYIVHIYMLLWLHTHSAGTQLMTHYAGDESASCLQSHHHQCTQMRREICAFDATATTSFLLYENMVISTYVLFARIYFYFKLLKPYSECDCNSFNIYMNVYAGKRTDKNVLCISVACQTRNLKYINTPSLNIAIIFLLSWILW